MKYVYIALGWIFFALGAIGAVFPVLPTTPFLLVASYCFAKGSERFYRYFTSTKLYKTHLEDFVQTRSMTLRSKITIVGFASAMLIIAFLMVDVIYARITIAIVMIVKYYYFIFRIKTIKGEN